MNNSNQQASTLIPIAIIGGLFFMFGFVTWLNGSLIPFLQIACQLSHAEAYLVTMAFYIAYVVTALPVSTVLRRYGYRRGITIGLVVMAVGALVFIPAALARMYSIFLIALFILGTGLTLLQTAANPYLVTIGPRETAAVRISLMGVLNKGAGVVAPIVFTALVFSDMSAYNDEALSVLSEQERAAALTELSQRLITPYLLMAGMLMALALFIHFSPLPEPEAEEDLDSTDEEGGILQQPHVVLGALTLFFYVGAEVIAGDTIGLFGHGLGVENFGQLTSYTMSFMVFGYVLGMILIPRWISQELALAISAVCGIVFCVLLTSADPASAGLWPMLFGWIDVPAIPDVVLYVALFGFANAMVWPAVWPLALADLNARQTSQGSALLIMGISGGAILPTVYGALADSALDPQQAYWLMLPCYLFILFYALVGKGLRQWPGAPRASMG